MFGLIQIHAKSLSRVHVGTATVKGSNCTLKFAGINQTEIHQNHIWIDVGSENELQAIVRASLPDVFFYHL